MTKNNAPLFQVRRDEAAPRVFSQESQQKRKAVCVSQLPGNVLCRAQKTGLQARAPCFRAAVSPVVSVGQLAHQGWEGARRLRAHVPARGRPQLSPETAGGLSRTGRSGTQRARNPVEAQGDRWARPGMVPGEPGRGIAGSRSLRLSSPARWSWRK